MKKVVIALALLGICSYFLFFRLGSYGLLETTDARYAEIGWEMFQGKDFITPHFDFIKHFHKPPFTYWMTALGYALLGENEWGARFFLGVFGLLTLGVVFLLGRLAFDTRVGAISVLILISMLGFLGATHVVATDLYLLFFICLAMYCFLRWERGQSSLLWGWIVLGVSTLVKGPVAPILVGVTCFLYLIFTGQIKRIKETQPIKGMALFLIIALPWYVWVCLHNKGLFTYFLKTQFFSRIETGTMGHPHPWYYYLPILPALLFPWTLYAIPAIARTLRHLKKMHFFFFLWAVVPFVLYSLMRTKLPFYILPCLPPLAILIAEWWVSEAERTDVDGSRWAKLLQGTMAFICLLFALAALIMAIPLFRGHGNILEWQQLKSLWWAEAILFMLIALALYLSLRLRKVWIHFICLLAMTNAFMLPLLCYGDKLPINTYRSLGVTIREMAGPNDLIVQYKCFLRALPFYVKRPTVLVDIPRETQFETNDDYKKILIDNKTFWEWWKGEKRIFCVVPKRILKDFLSKGYYFVTQRRKYVVITNKPLLNQGDTASTLDQTYIRLALVCQ